jgi:hypothetical protein
VATLISLARRFLGWLASYDEAAQLARIADARRKLGEAARRKRDAIDAAVTARDAADNARDAVIRAEAARAQARMTGKDQAGKR